MAVIKVEVKNQLNIGKKPRVYFTCHPDDFDKDEEKTKSDNEESQEILSGNSENIVTEEE